MQALPSISDNMDNNNQTTYREEIEQWLINIYLQEFAGLKMYAVHILHNETDADNIVGQGFEVLARELCNNPGKFSSPAKAKAFLTTVIRNKCYSWLRKKQPVTMYESAEAMEAIMDEDHLVSMLEERDRLQHILSLLDKLPTQLQQVALLYLKEGLTCEEVEKRLHIKKTVLRVYKSRLVHKLREMVCSRKNITIKYAEALNIQDERSSAQPVNNLL